MNYLKKKLQAFISAMDKKQAVTVGECMDQGVAVKDNRYCTTDYIKLPDNCTSLTINHNFINVNINCITFYNKNGDSYTYNTYYKASTSPRTINQMYSRYIKATFLLSDLANCYVYDNTNNEYLWKY